MARLFFALWPDADAARALARLGAELAARCGGRAVPESKIHLTLAFLGEVGSQRAAELLEFSLRGRAFELRLDHAGAFRKARVAWAGVDPAPAGLLELQAALAARLRESGFELEDRQFAPHVTLVRRIERGLERLAVEPVAWRAREAALVESERASGRYTTLRAWALEG